MNVDHRCHSGMRLRFLSCRKLLQAIAYPSDFLLELTVGLASLLCLVFPFLVRGSIWSWQATLEFVTLSIDYAIWQCKCFLLPKGTPVAIPSWSPLWIPIPFPVPSNHEYSQAKFQPQRCFPFIPPQEASSSQCMLWARHSPKCSPCWIHFLRWLWQMTISWVA